MALATRASVRPLTITRHPSAASDLAMAKPIPAVEPVTRASLFSIFRFVSAPTGFLSLIYPLDWGRQGRWVAGKPFGARLLYLAQGKGGTPADRKSTRLNS